MKNLKNMFTAGILAAVLMVGATSAHAGLYLSDRASSSNEQCAADDTSILDVAGIILLDIASTGLYLSDRAQPVCTQNDRDGLYLSD